jgi:hypothetical protein
MLIFRPTRQTLVLITSLYCLLEQFSMDFPECSELKKIYDTCFNEKIKSKGWEMLFDPANAQACNQQFEVRIK